MSKLHVLARKCAALPTLLHFLVQHIVQLSREKCSSSAALFSPMVRRISRLKTAIYRSSKCSSVGTSPNFAQELENGYLYCGEYQDPYGADEFDQDDYGAWAYHDEMEKENASWHERAVNEAISEEGEDEYPRTDRSHGDW